MTDATDRSAGDGPRATPRLAVPAGLCADCRHRELVASQRTAFVRCGLARRDAAYPRYPRLPVVACRGYERLEAVAERGEGERGAAAPDGSGRGRRGAVSEARRAAAGEPGDRT